MAQPTILPTLHYRARPGITPASLSISRASSATRVNALGLIETVPAGVLRHDYDPITGEYLGWLMEGQRTNLIQYSEQFDNAVWAKLAASVVPNAAVSPDGAMSADRLIEDATNNVHQVWGYYPNFVSGSIYTISVFAKTSGRNLTLCFGNVAYNAFPRAVFNLTTGTYTITNGGGVASITPFGNGWYRCAYTCAATASIGDNVFIGLVNNNEYGYLGNGGGAGIYIWGAQLEAGAFSTSYIMTGASSATRSGDYLTAQTSSFPINPYEGTLYFDGDVLSLPSGTAWNTLYAVHDGTDSNVHRAIINNAGGIYWSTRSGGADQLLSSAAGISAGARIKSAQTYKQDAGAACLNAGAVMTDASGTVPLALTTLTIGNTAPGNAAHYGHIRQIGYFPRRLADMHIQTITA